MRGDEMILCEDDVELTRIGRPERRIEKGNVDGQEQAAVILDDFRLIRRRDQLFDRERMNVEILLKIRDVDLLRIVKIDPCEILFLDDVHFRFFVCRRLLPVPCHVHCTTLSD